MPNRRIEVLYIVANEDLTSPLLSRQVTELLQEKVSASGGTLHVRILLFQTVTSLIKRWRGLARLRKDLERNGVSLSIIPNIAPWPIPNVRLKKTDVGLRPDGRWTRFAAKTFAVYAFPWLLYQHKVKRNCIFHSRSYPPAYAVYTFRRVFPRVKHIFDPRSDFPEENVVAGRWAADSGDFRFWKDAERQVIRDAYTTVCISEKYVEHYSETSENFPYIVAPNNVDTARFQFDQAARSRVRKALGWSESDLVFVYLGGMSKSGWHRPEFYRDFIVQARGYLPQAKLLMLVPSSATEWTRQCLSDLEGVAIEHPRFQEVSKWLSGADIGLVYTHKRRLAVGTKLGEYLANGLPIVCNSNCLGTVRFINSNPRTGLVADIGLGDLDHGAALEGIDQQRPVRSKCGQLQTLAEKVFDNRAVAARYLRVYRESTRD